MQLIVDDDFIEIDTNNSVDAATARIADEHDNNNQSLYLQLNDKLREKLTPIFNRKHYSSLPQASLSYFEHKSRKNSYSAYFFWFFILNIFIFKTHTFTSIYILFHLAHIEHRHNYKNGISSINLLGRCYYF